MLVIRGARLIDGTGAEPVEDAVLLADDDRIVYVGSRAGASGIGVPEGSVVVNAPGYTLIPGLIDCHVHLCFDGDPDFEGFARALTPETARAVGERNARRTLEAGITMVRDLGGVGSASIGLARAQRAGAISGPRVLTAGEVLTVPGGHAHFMGREVSSIEQMTASVRALRDAGADVVKLMATGGVLTAGIGAQQSAFPDEQLAAGVMEAHARGMRVAAHAIGAEGIEAAARAGVDSIEHGCFLSEGAIAAMLNRPAWLVATLSAPDRISHGGDGVPDYARAKSAEVLEVHRESFARAVRAGCRIAAGTDAGTPYNFHGDLARELFLMHEAGMPLERILVAATREAAQLLGAGDLGTLEAGKIADAVLLDGDPLTDVGAYRNVMLVVQSGRVVVERGRA